MQIWDVHSFIEPLSLVSEKQQSPESWNKKMQNIRQWDRTVHLQCKQCGQHYLGVINTLLQGAEAWHFLQVCGGIEHLQQKLKTFFFISWYNLQFKHLLHQQFQSHSWKCIYINFNTLRWFGEVRSKTQKWDEKCNFVFCQCNISVVPYYSRQDTAGMLLMLEWGVGGCLGSPAMSVAQDLEHPHWHLPPHLLQPQLDLCQLTYTQNTLHIWG